ncbi:hypothetical protein [Bacillus marinisedimentorum]|uniref:hypothetical protein n=1 Tax=Bacillus marinisedimentorum TaxID=1821260 RepID=UPI00087271B2|nr:hypothetical protein [Bacillus marinisedimentorum]
MKRLILYALYAAVMGALVYWGFKVPLDLRNTFYEGVPMGLVLIYATLFPVMIGMLFRLPTFIRDIKEGKEWSINWAKLLGIGLPALYVSQMMHLYFSLPFGRMLPFGAAIVGNSDIPLALIAGIALGYVMLDSLKEA